MIDIDLRNFQHLIFKSKTDRRVSELLNALGTEFRYSQFPDTYYHIYENLGVELAFNKEHYLLTIFVYQKSAQFIRMLAPYDLSLSLRMKEVETIMGVPERSGGGSNTMNYWVSYPDKGISLDYQTKEKDNLEAPIHCISFKQPETELSRIRFVTKSEIHIYFQVRSLEYSVDIIGNLLQLEPDRVDENLYEIYLTRNPHLSMKTQLAEVMSFLDIVSQKILKLSDQVNFKLKINIISFRSNAVRFKLISEQIKRLYELGIEIEYEFIT